MVRFSGAERMVSCGDDSVIRVWDCGKLKRCTVLKGHSNSVSAFKLQSENEIYSVSKDMTIRRWDLRVADSTATSRPQDSELTYIANNTDRIVASHRDGTVSFFRPDLEVEHSVRVHEEEIRSV
jgi:WD40 repeat protein